MCEATFQSHGHRLHSSPPWTHHTHGPPLCSSPNPECPWCQIVPETIEHFLLQCSHFHFHHVIRSQILFPGVNTFDLPTLLVAVVVHPTWQLAVICLTPVSASQDFARSHRAPRLESLQSSTTATPISATELINALYLCSERVPRCPARRKNNENQV